ncbi:Unknown protein sequence [Pseudomonas cannabina]|uniref:Uncharacterized protein n=1 Tax=Pseudomonas cannabina TaxID=86840 RepID=A0A0P9LBS1_PSECA|nr:Unknown protein sequence [Pseudomonas cannabina]
MNSAEHHIVNNRSKGLGHFTYEQCRLERTLRTEQHRGRIIFPDIIRYQVLVLYRDVAAFLTALQANEHQHGPVAVVGGMRVERCSRIGLGAQFKRLWVNQVIGATLDHAKRPYALLVRQSVEQGFEKSSAEYPVSPVSREGQNEIVTVLEVEPYPAITLDNARHPFQRKIQCKLRPLQRIDMDNPVGFPIVDVILHRQLSSAQDRTGQCRMRLTEVIVRERQPGRIQNEVVNIFFKPVAQYHLSAHRLQIGVRGKTRDVLLKQQVIHLASGHGSDGIPTPHNIIVGVFHPLGQVVQRVIGHGVTSVYVWVMPVAVASCASPSACRE